MYIANIIPLEKNLNNNSENFTKKRRNFKIRRF